ncbi:MAG: P-loop NTPase fold protein [Xenococcaceae cyanobacterium]
MGLTVQKFYQATNPLRALFVDNAKEDEKYYIDFSSVRGGPIIEELRDNITKWSPNKPTCQLFTGHVGCGKSTELHRLKAELEKENFHVVYFESSQDLELEDVDVSDILLAIARRVAENLKDEGISLQPGYFKTRFQEIKEILQMSVDITEMEFSLGIATITAQAKASPDARDKLRGYLEPRTGGIIDAINQEVLEPAIKKLKVIRKQRLEGLVVIVDNLDRVGNTIKASGRRQQEYLFVDRGEQLRSLNCHVIYTMPLPLRFSDDFEAMVGRFDEDPKVLPMVPVQLRNGSKCEEGMKLLRQMVLARAFPDLNEEQRLSQITEVFDSPETLDRLCSFSGGHVRNLLRLLNDSIKREKRLPISYKSLEDSIRLYSNHRIRGVNDGDWEWLRRVAQQKDVSGDDIYKTLLRCMFVYEYTDSQGAEFPQPSTGRVSQTLSLPAGVLGQ